MHAATAPVLLTAGDPAGIGPEITLQACLQQADWARDAVIVGHLPSLQRAAQVLQLAQPIPFQTVDLTHLAGDRKSTRLNSSH